MPTFNENVILGNGNRIGVGTTTPTEPVHVVGALRVVNGLPHGIRTTRCAFPYAARLWAR